MSKTIGKYTIESRLGEGGMGIVYKAHDGVLDRIVALKTIAPSLSADSRAKERLLREAQAAAKLQHPNIVSTYDLGDVDGQLFIAMEYLEGRSLEDAMGESADSARLVEIMLQTCRALAHAHRHGVVHRDVKPSNIHLTPDGNVKLLDFGIAHLENSNLTQTGTHLGTPEYMSPEMVEGDALDQRSDVFSCGVVFYEMISAKKPFKHKRVTTTLYNILSVEPPPLREVAPDTPPALERIVAGMIVKDRTERYQDLSEVIADLEAIQARTLLTKTDRIKEMRSELEGLTGIWASVADDPPAEALLRERFGEAIETREKSVRHLSRASDSKVTEARIEEEIDRIRSLRRRIDDYRKGPLLDDLERSHERTLVITPEMIEAAAVGLSETEASRSESPDGEAEGPDSGREDSSEAPERESILFQTKTLVAAGVLALIVVAAVVAASYPWSSVPPQVIPPDPDAALTTEIPLETRLQDAYRAQDAATVLNLIGDLEGQGSLSASQSFFKGWSLSRLGRFADAVRPLRASLDQDSSNQSAQVLLGHALWKSTQRNEPARRHFLNALRKGSLSRGERTIVRDGLLAMSHRFDVRHAHRRRFGIVGSRGDCPGALTVMADAVEFKSESHPRHDFKLALDQVEAVEIVPNGLRVLSGKDRHEFEWVNPGAERLLQTLMTQIHGFESSSIEDGTRLAPKAQ